MRLRVPLWAVVLLTMSCDADGLQFPSTGPSSGGAVGTGATTGAAGMGAGETTLGGGGSGDSSTSSSSGTTGSGGLGAAGGTGGSGGIVIAGCDPPSPYGANCAEDVCGSVENYIPSATCAKSCLDEATEVGSADVPTDNAWIFSDFSNGPACNDCAWSFVVRVGGKGCARATSSPGIHVATTYEASVCGPASAKACVYDDAVEGNPSDDLRIIATVAPGQVPTSGWLRIETITQACAGSGFGCN